MVKPNLPLRRRVPKTFIVVVALFTFWFAITALAVVFPGALNTLYFLAQQIAGWVFVIVVAVVGALLLGMFISHRLLTHGGFTPFEEEMMRMRKDVQQSLGHTEKMREEVSLMRVEVARMRRAPRGGAPRAGDEVEHAHAREAGAKAGASASPGEGADDLDEFRR